MTAPAPFFSVIIPVFNRAEGLRTAIASVLEQSCRDLEIVVVDDGSADDPRAVADSFADPRIRFFRQDNAGGGAARNTALEKARGRFIAPLDSDDVFLPGHLERMRALLEGTTATVGYARILVDRGQDRIIVKPPRAIAPDEDMATYLLCDRGFVPTITTVAPRDAACRVRYHTDLRAAEDTDFAIRLALDGCRFRMIAEPGAVWKDLADPNRASSDRNRAAFGAWLEAMKPRIPAIAWHGARGWALAKMVARDQPLRALYLYCNAVLRGCYRPSLAVVVFLQIFLGRGGYRLVADRAISWLQLGLKDRDRKAAPKPEQA